MTRKKPSLKPNNPSEQSKNKMRISIVDYQNCSKNSSKASKLWNLDIKNSTNSKKACTNSSKLTPTTQRNWTRPKNYGNNLLNTQKRETKRLKPWKT